MKGSRRCQASGQKVVLWTTFRLPEMLCCNTWSMHHIRLVMHGITPWLQIPSYPVLVTGVENRLLIYDWLSSDWYDITIWWQHLPLVHQMTVFSAGNLETMADITENDVHVR